MKKIIKISCIVICLLLSAPVLSGAKEYDGDRGRISYVESYSDWYYVYDVSVSSSGFTAWKQDREIQYNLKGERL